MCFIERLLFKRKLYIVSVVDWVKMRSQDNILTVCLNFDLYKLLLMSYINNNYAKIRLDEFNKLKKLLDSQVFVFPENNKDRFDRIVLDYFVTANPLLIKLKILERWIVKSFLNGNNDREMFISYLSKLMLNRRQLKRIYSQVAEKKKYTQLKAYLVEGDMPALEFYIRLLQHCHSNAASRSTVSDLGSCKDYIEIYKISNPQYYQTMGALIKDCIRHYQDSYICDQFGKTSSPAASSDQYEEAYKRKADLYQHIAVYTEPRNSFNHYEQTDRVPVIGYYKDMFFFYLANEQLNNT